VGANRERQGHGDDQTHSAQQQNINTRKKVNHGTNPLF
jgi:hypothetical protein